MNMLTALSIKNYAIIGDVSVEPDTGLNILTGETGAGKSIIIDALGMILGDRANVSMIRKDFSSCEITASFYIKNHNRIFSFLESMGLRAEETLVVKRDFYRDGRTKCFINGAPSTVGMLQSLGEYLVDVHGQHEHQSLIKPETQRLMLDSFGRLDGITEKVSRQFSEFTDIGKRLRELLNSEREREQKLDIYRYQLKEIESASLENFNEEDAVNEFNRLNNAEKLAENASGTYSLLYDSEGSVTEKLGAARRFLENLVSIDGTLAEHLNSLLSAEETLKNVSEDIRSYRDGIEFNPRRLEDLISKTELLKRLKKKYAPTVKDILKYASDIKKEMEFLEHADEAIEELTKDLKSAEQKLKKSALELSKLRLDTAKKLSNDINKELADLGMGKAKFCICVEPEKDEKGGYVYKSFGIDKIEYKISTNPGEEMKPISHVASGGEMSRVMLALKTSLARQDKTPTLIFDEIDAGLSGPMGQAVGKKLKALSDRHQIICITHLAQLASFSDAHFHITKKTIDNRTTISVKRLTDAEKLEEVSRMLGGAVVTKATIKHAEELIKQAK
ncbi:MAG: DNA repair protein RecN [Elusimicrobia bacterium ADurb.Bin231]|nr:MAG: DNA repair protein RecN [Elusimicrobia bacterium ADurb.Bin231]